LILRYRTILWGYLNYYSFVDNRYALRRIFYILKGSLQKTICRKFGIRISECLKKYGSSVTLKVPRRDGSIVFLDFKCPPLPRNPMGFLGEKEFEDPLAAKN
jgi:hypothetical protein